MSSNNQLSLFQSKFDRRFLEDYVGKSILRDPKVALIELIANAWDAGASEVQVVWPDDHKHLFSVEDNGCGLSESEFYSRWMVLSYDRIDAQGKWAEIPARLKNDQNIGKRRVFGQHGKGRHGGFCFSDDGYFVETAKNGRKITFRVFIPSTGETPIASEKTSDVACSPLISGTKIYVKNANNFGLSAEAMRAEIGLRFLSDPNFRVLLNKKPISFADLPSQNCTPYQLHLSNKEIITILKIDVKESDRTTKQHGIAWQVLGRLVGNIDWKNLSETFMDGRRSVAKRFSFIVKADCLAEHVASDWMGFRDSEALVKEAMLAVSERIKAILFEASKEQRTETFNGIVKKNSSLIRDMGQQERNLWALAVKKIQQDCPSLSDSDIESVSGILAKMEASKSKFGLLNKLHLCSVNDIDALDQILETWKVESAKIVLDVLETRLKLIDELSCKVMDKDTDEVQELQPLFKQGLWIFGPEFEAVGFTSNRGMTHIIREIFHDEKKGSRNRPDFVVTPDSSLGFYAHSKYDEKTGGENGISRLVIIELKKPSVPLGGKEKDQCWKYVKELLEKGCITEDTRVNCYVLGRTIAKFESSIREENNVRIEPLTYDTVLTRAKSRTHLLYEKVKDEAPFLQTPETQEIEAALSPVVDTQRSPEFNLTVAP